VCHTFPVRRVLTWLLALPVIVVGSEVAHGLAYWWAYPDTDLRAAVLARTGHGYFAWAPVAIALLAAIELVALGVDVADRARNRPSRQLPAWAFFVIPVVGFTLQEHLERLFDIGVFPWWAALEPSFWRGLVLQIPLGLAAYLIARLLSRAASAAARVLRREPTVARRRPATRRLPVALLLPRLAPLAGSSAGRAPPVAVVL
jgi:hypothetical protein